MHAAIFVMVAAEAGVPLLNLILNVTCTRHGYSPFKQKSLWLSPQAPLPLVELVSLKLESTCAYAER
jgi:hypothetical protein